MRLNRFFKKKYHWYEVKFIYRSKLHGKEILNFRYFIRLDNQRDCLDSRKIKNTLIPLHLMDGVEKQHLCNGVLHYQIKCYLGRFSK